MGFEGYVCIMNLEFLDEKFTVGKKFPGHEIPVWSKFPPAPADITSKDGLEKINFKRKARIIFVVTQH